MSQENLQKAKDRLLRAKQEIYWALDLLGDPTTNSKQYDLTQEEEDELFQECHLQMAEIQNKITQTFTKKEIVIVMNKSTTIVGPIPLPLRRILTNVGGGGYPFPDTPDNVGGGGYPDETESSSNEQSP